MWAERCKGTECYVQNYILERSLWFRSEGHSQSRVREISHKTFTPKGKISSLGWGRAGVMEWDGFESYRIGEIEGARQLGGLVSPRAEETGLSSWGAMVHSEITERGRLSTLGEGRGNHRFSYAHGPLEVLLTPSWRYQRGSCLPTDSSVHRFSTLGFECSWGSWPC